jgi:hypothetical protein
MKHELNRRTPWTSLISAAIVTALVLASFVSVGTAYADEGVDPAVEKHGGQLDERLETCFNKLNEWYQIQDGNLGKANTAVDRVEETLARAAELGIDTSAIEALMPGLYAAVAQAEAFHARANQILSEHTGYNGSGKVKDRQQALETCTSARDALASARGSLLEAREIVRQIIELAKDLRGSYVPPTDAAS